MQPPAAAPPSGPAPAHEGFSSFARAANHLALPTPSASGSSSNTSAERFQVPGRARTRTVTASPLSDEDAAAAAARAPPVVHAGPRAGTGILDLTSSSPPSSARRRSLPAAAVAAGLVLPGAGAGPSNVGASTSGSTAARGSGPRRARFDSTSAALGRAATTTADQVTLSSGSDSSESASDPDYAPPPRAGPSRAQQRARVAAPRRAAAAEVLVADSDNDSEVEIVSVGPVRPARQPGFNDVLGSPPPYVVPPGATRVRRSTRARNAARSGSGSGPNAAAFIDDDDDPDAAAARALAAADARAAGVGRGGAGFGDYLAAQAAAYDQARAASSRYDALRELATGGHGARSGAGWGIFSRTGGLGGSPQAQALIDNLRFLSNLAPGGAFWPGGAGGGAGGYGYGAGAQNGWGGAAKVKAASKKYSVRLSHPDKVERGFSRDVLEPPDPDAAAAAAPPPAKKAKRAGAKARPPPEELEPVCASCLETLLLGGEGARKVFALRCGHAVCARCLDEAKERCRAIADAEKGRTTTSGSGAGRRTKGKGKGKGKGKAREDAMDEDGDDDSDGDYDAPAPSSKSKGKARSRADETGVEEDWTTCPVAACDGRGTDLLASEGWSRPFELFA